MPCFPKDSGQIRDDPKQKSFRLNLIYLVYNSGVLGPDLERRDWKVFFQAFYDLFGDLDRFAKVLSLTNQVLSFLMAISNKSKAELLREDFVLDDWLEILCQWEDTEPQTENRDRVAHTQLRVQEPLAVTPQLERVMNLLDPQRQAPTQGPMPPYAFGVRDGGRSTNTQARQCNILEGHGNRFVERASNPHHQHHDMAKPGPPPPFFPSINPLMLDVAQRHHLPAGLPRSHNHTHDTRRGRVDQTYEVRGHAEIFAENGARLVAGQPGQGPCALGGQAQSNPNLAPMLIIPTVPKQGGRDQAENPPLLVASSLQNHGSWDLHNPPSPVASAQNHRHWYPRNLTLLTVSTQNHGHWDSNTSHVASVQNFAVSGTKICVNQDGTNAVIIDKRQPVSHLLLRRNPEPTVFEWSFAGQQETRYDCWWKGKGLEDCLLGNIVSLQPFLNTMNRKSSLSEFVAGVYLNRGGFGEIVTALHKKSKYLCVLKMVDTKADNAPDFEEERSIQKRLSGHPNILRLFGSFHSGHYFIMILEYAPLGDLKCELKKSAPQGLNHADTATYILGLVEALRYCHWNRVIHRDIKPENLLMFGNKTVKLADFGLSTSMHAPGQAPHTDYCGTLEYMAPEMVARRGYDEKVDIWAVGVVLYQCLYNLLPFCGYRDCDIELSIIRDALTFPAMIENNCAQLLLGLICKEPKHRMGLDQVMDNTWLASVLSHN